jgi:hypothetical protein
MVGAVKATTAPESGLLPESRTMTLNGVLKAVLTVATCGLPAWMLIEPTAMNVEVFVKIEIVLS